MNRKYYKAIPRELSTNDFWSLGMVIDKHYPYPPNDIPKVIEITKEQFEEILE